MKPTWAEGQVLQAAGFDSDKASPALVQLAAVALERYYYIDQAAMALCRMLARLEYVDVD